MIHNKYIHSFWHQKDHYTITSKGYIWSYPGYNKFINCIDVMPESLSEYHNVSEYYPKNIGVCSDYIKIIRRNYYEKQKS